MVDFAAIRTHRGSQNTGFEELVVQLARRRPPLGGTSFRRIEGAGGDSGVEALWLKSDGSAIGLQAKYFLRVRDIDWGQIDKSVEATLEHRPEVNLYQIALACDLTDRRGAKGQGKTGWETWEARVKRWEQDALALGRSIRFEPITASDLVDWLGQPSAAGLARYWFGTDVLGSAWFSEQVRIASADLGERYTPEQHVEVAASLSFEGIARTSALRRRLRDAVQETWKHGISAGPAAVDDVTAAATRAHEALRGVFGVADGVDLPVSTPWEIQHWLTNVRASQEAVELLEDELRKQERAAGEAKQESALGEFLGHYRYNIRQVDQALRDLSRLLGSVAFEVDRSRVLIVTGEAGTGKSHLLAAEANRAVSAGRPALLFLGQQFGQGNPWDQCERSLGLRTWSRDELFGALDAAGEAAGTRTLILVDAVNEGAGANLWRSSLAGFIESLATYRHVAVVIACRSEYVPFAIPEAVLEAYPRIELQGFATFEEQEAAAVQYLDRRGIVRPAGPLLAPEFSHPLFLKAASDALLKKQEFVFPRGLRGALNILGFYLDSVGGNLLPPSVEPADLSRELRRGLTALGQNMADSKLDYVPRSEAEHSLALTFAPRSPPPGLTWLEVLLRNGIIRLDPDPTAQGGEAFVAPEDVVRIAFQRFQDHLVVQAALAGQADASALFAVGGRLEWLVSNTWRYRWTGLFEALSIQIPEAFGVELVDVLPGGAERWWQQWGIQDGFIQSVRWRALKTQKAESTFTARSLELLNSLNEYDGAPLPILLEVAAVPDHPWNADFLHRNFWRWDLNKRDRLWSRVIAFATDDDEHPVHRLLTWSLGGNLGHAERDMLRLVMIVLTWLCSTTSRYLRDFATRALCRLLASAPDLHHDNLALFAQVDDLYVLERLLAASYGAACQLGDHPVLQSFASSTFEFVFKEGRPPQHLLARDYALGTLELARHYGRLPSTVELERARPPFAAKALRAPSKATLEKWRDRIGDHSIFFSCVEHGDFARYEIATAVDDFSATKLEDPIPLSDRNRFDLFVSDVVDPDPGKRAAFNALEGAVGKAGTLRFDSIRGGIRLSQSRSDEALEEALKLERDFLVRLTTLEEARYREVARGRLFDRRGERRPPTFDPNWAQRWVTARAYRLGWTKDKFGEDRTPTEYDRSRSRIERVGKKYQWIALYELLGWLSDTHWIKGDWGEMPRPYAYPTDTAFQRDLDPTLVSEADIEPAAEESWWRLDFDLRPIADDQLTAWAERNDPWHSSESAIFRRDMAGDEWITLYSFQRATERFSDREFVRREVGLRREGFQFVQALIIARKDLQKTHDAMVSARQRDTHTWEASKLTDGPFVGEIGWRATWPDLAWSPAYRLPGEVRALRPVVEYWWESHLDASRPNGVEQRFPSPELLRLLGLTPPAPRSPDTTTDGTGRAVIVHRKGHDHGYSVAIRRDALERLLADYDLGCLWFISSERSAWPTGGHDQSTRRWFGGVVQFDGARTRSFEWETPW